VTIDWRNKKKKKTCHTQLNTIYELREREREKCGGDAERI